NEMASENAVSSIEKAIKLYEEITDWKDSREKIDECKAKIEEVKAAEEKAEAERIRKAEEEKAAKEAAKEESLKKTRKYSLIGLVATITLVVLVSLLTKVIIPSGNYKKALAEVEAGNYEEAYSLFNKYPDYKDTKNKIKSIIKPYYKSKWGPVNVGDIIMFGSYEQDNDTTNGKEEIEWRILAKEGNKLLIISKYALDNQPFNTEYEHTTWETCTLRKWMNYSFLEVAFSNAEQGMIKTTKATADKYPKSDTDSGKDSTDKVFLLSINEAEKYFSSDKDRECVATHYAIYQGADTEKDGATCSWWLRTTDEESLNALYVHYYFDFWTMGARVNIEHCVRPAMWIEI
ncbi:MAG: hypothetical protein IKN56_09085, partial [Clostridia bacterium]|nr:hypothetical protein [Clostridia bacterium]